VCSRPLRPCHFHSSQFVSVSGGVERLYVPLLCRHIYPPPLRYHIQSQDCGEMDELLGRQNSHHRDYSPLHNYNARSVCVRLKTNILLAVCTFW
jgi:hypothetical protein